MTAQTLEDRMRQLLAETAANIAAGTPNPGAQRATEDPDRMRPGLSRRARHSQRRPEPWVVDELGYAPNGAWTGGAA